MAITRRRIWVPFLSVLGSCRSGHASWWHRVAIRNPWYPSKSTSPSLLLLLFFLWLSSSSTTSWSPATPVSPVVSGTPLTLLVLTTTTYDAAVVFLPRAAVVAFAAAVVAVSAIPVNTIVCLSIGEKKSGVVSCCCSSSSSSRSSVVDVRSTPLRTRVVQVVSPVQSAAGVLLPASSVGNRPTTPIRKRGKHFVPQRSSRTPVVLKAGQDFLACLSSLLALSHRRRPPLRALTLAGAQALGR